MKRKDYETKRREQIISELKSLSSQASEALALGCQGVSLPVLEIFYNISKSALSGIMSLLGGSRLDVIAQKHGVTEVTIRRVIADNNLTPIKKVLDPQLTYVPKETVDKIDEIMSKR